MDQHGERLLSSLVGGGETGILRGKEKRRDARNIRRGGQRGQAVDSGIVPRKPPHVKRVKAVFSMAATVNQLIAAAKKQAAIANGIERAAALAGPFDAARLAGGIAALNVAKIGGAVVIDPRAAVQAVITPIVLDVMEAGRQAAWRGLQMQIPLAMPVLLDVANFNRQAMRLSLGLDLGRLFTDWQDRSLAPVIAGMAEVRAALLEYRREGTFTGDVLRVAYEGEYYTQEEAEAALDRLVAITFTERSVFGEDVDPDLWPLLAPSLLRQAIREIPDGVSDAKLKRWLRARMAQLAGARYMRQCRVMREALIPQSGQVLTLASAPALESGAGPAPSDGQRIAPDGPKVPSRPADYMRWSRIWLYVRSRIGKDGNEEICDWLGKVHKEKCSEDTLSKIIKAGLAGLLDNPKLG